MIDPTTIDATGVEPVVSKAKPGYFGWWGNIPTGGKRTLLIVIALGVVMCTTVFYTLSGGLGRPSDLAPKMEGDASGSKAGAVAVQQVDKKYKDIVTKKEAVNVKKAEELNTSYIPNAVTSFPPSSSGVQADLPSLSDDLDKTAKPTAKPSATQQEASSQPLASAPPAVPATFDASGYTRPVVGSGPRANFSDHSPDSEEDRASIEQKMAYLQQILGKARDQQSVVTVTPNAFALQPNNQAFNPNDSARNAAAPNVSGTQNNPASTTVSSQASTQAKQLQPALLAPGDRLMASLDVALNTDEPAQVLATVIDGPFTGAKLIGEFTKGTEAVVIKFNSITYKGYTTSLKSVALDGESEKNYIASAVDTHFWSRWGSLILSGAASGALNALQQTRGTVSGQSSGTTIVNPNPPADREIVLAITGGAGQAANQVLQARFNQPATVTVDKNLILWALILEPVKSDWLPASLINYIAKKSANNATGMSTVVERQ